MVLNLSFELQAALLNLFQLALDISGRTCLRWVLKLFVDRRRCRGTLDLPYPELLLEV